MLQFSFHYYMFCLIAESHCTPNKGGFVHSARSVEGEALIKKRTSDAINGVLKGLKVFDIITNNIVKK